MTQPSDKSNDPNQASFRTWADVTGKYKAEAELVEFKDEKVLLRKRDGRVATVPIEKLSLADRDFVRQRVADARPAQDAMASGRDTPSRPAGFRPAGTDSHPEPAASRGGLDKPDDRPKPATPQGDLEEAKIFIVVNGQKFPKPGLETFFAQSGVGKDPQCTCHPVARVFCSCNKVCVCVPVRSPVESKVRTTVESKVRTTVESKVRVPVKPSGCGCVGYTACSCVGHSRCSCVGHSSGGSGGGIITGCRCAPVH